ncbi:MAG: hypothetical protein H3C41_02585 [Bacteroidales bacterium]|nr:hypothetical protein [Bacteroidales bacterium]
MKFSDKLNEFDVLDLLNEYHSELRKLKNKLTYVKKRIGELEDEYQRILRRQEKKASRLISDDQFAEFPENMNSEDDTAALTVDTVEEAETVQRKKREPKEKKVKKTTRKKKSAKLGRKQQPLSEWDQMIVDAVKTKGKAAINSEILETVTKVAIERGLYKDEEKTKAKINQCLVKLTADNRKALIKVPYSGRGFGYALPKWVDKEGQILEAYSY